MTTAGSEEKRVSETTFTCRFCGEVKPISELTLQTRFFPVLTACRDCDRKMQNLNPINISAQNISEKSSPAI